VFDGSLRPASEVFAGTSHVFAKVFAAAQYAAMSDVSSHASTGLAYLRAAFFHLPGRGVVVLLSSARYRRQD
jgi:hypothetical protein